MFFNETISNINRIRQLAEVLLKYGFGDVVASSKLYQLLPARRRASLKEQNSYITLSRWERIRLMLEELGPTYIKLGQLLGNRPDLLPEPLIKELEKLQDNVPPFDVEEAKAIIEKEIGEEISELFVYFDEKPLGSASIGQVHRARLRTGEDVVIKVQRPNASKKVNVDLNLMREFVKLTENYFVKSGILKPLDVLDAFAKSITSELDYDTEAMHLEQFRLLYGHINDFYVPKPYRDLSSKKVLVVEFVSGCKITDTDTLESWGLNPKEIALRGSQIYLSQIFEYGIFHADPHPGNILIKPGGIISLIDFGNVGKLMQQQKYAFSGVFVSLAKKDAKGMAINLRRLSIDHDIRDMKEFEYDLNDLIQDYVVLDTGDMTFKDFTARIQKVAFKYKLQIPGSVFLIFRALAILEGISKSLDPSFDTLEAVRPFGFKLFAEQFKFSTISEELRHTLFQVFTLFYNLPEELRDIIKQLRRGTITVNVKETKDERFLNKVDFIGRAFILSVIASSFIVGSAISFRLDASANKLTWDNFPVFSAVFFLFGMSVLFILFFYTITKGRK